MIFSRTIIFLSVLVLVFGCGTTREKALEKGKPLPLEKFEKRVKLKRLWKTDVGSGQGKNYNRLTLGVSREGVCAAEVKGGVECFSHEGKKQWRIKIKGGISAGVGVSPSLVYVADTSGVVVALSRLDGEEKWRADAGSEVLAAPQGNSDYVVVQTADGRLLGLSAESGEKLWEFKNDEPLLTLRGTSTPVVDGRFAYTGFASGKVIAIALENGALQWDRTVALAKGVTEIERLVDVDGELTVTSDAVYGASYNGYLFSFGKHDGRPRWRFETSTYRSTASGFGKVYLVESDSRIYALDEKDGEQRWEQSDLLNRELSAPVVFGGYLMVADLKGRIHILSQVDGALVGRARVDRSGVRVPMIPFRDQLYVYANDGELSSYRIEQL